MTKILLFAGIANPYPLENLISKMGTDLTTFYFKDHHQYSEDDIKKIRTKFNDLPGSNKVIITTEKDAMRLSKPELFDILKDLPVYYLPVEIEFHKEDKALFDEQVINYISFADKYD